MLGEASHLEGVMCDLSIRVRQSEAKFGLSIPDIQTPDPPVEPMGVLQHSLGLVSGKCDKISHMISPQSE